MLKKTFTILIAFVTILCLGACGKKGAGLEPSSSNVTAPDANRLVAVQAGEFFVYADQIQQELDILFDSYELSGTTLTQEERSALVQETVDNYIVRVLIKARLKQLGKDSMDEATLYELRNQAQKNYDAYWQQFRNASDSSGMTDEELTTYLEENGIDLDYFFDSLQTEYEAQQIMKHYKIKINVTDSDIDTFFDENYVQPARERYEKNIPLFEEEVLYGDYDSAYVPEGFRILYQIVIPVPENIRSELTRIENEANVSAQEAEDSYNKIASYVMEGKDTTQLEDTYRKAMNHIDELNMEYGKKWQEAKSATAEESDSLYAQLLSGKSFEELMKSYDPDNSIVYHSQSQYWSEELMAGANTLQKIGDYSQPTLCSDGVHILYYAEDIPGGATALEKESDRTLLRELLEQQRSFDALKELTTPWAEEFNLKTNLSSLVY